MLYFIRHGQSEANLKGVFAGQRDDSLLTEKGREQALVTAQELLATGVVFDRVISSPLKRTLETADIVAKEIGFDVSKIEIDPRITEYDMGNWTGTPTKTITSLELCAGENAEDSELFKKRIMECIQELSALPENILLVSHGGVLKMLKRVQLGLDSKLYYDFQRIENASITKIDWM